MRAVAARTRGRARLCAITAAVGMASVVATVFQAEIAAHSLGRCTATTNEPFLPVPAAVGGLASGELG